MQLESYPWWNLKWRDELGSGKKLPNLEVSRDFNKGERHRRGGGGEVACKACEGTRTLAMRWGHVPLLYQKQPWEEMVLL